MRSSSSTRSSISRSDTPVSGSTSSHASHQRRSSTCPSASTRSQQPGSSFRIPRNSVRGAGDAEEGQVVVERLLVDGALLLRVEEQRLDLRREHKPVVVNGVVERLDPDAVAHEPQLAGPAVPQRDREHAAEAVEAVDAPLLVRVDDHLGVGVVGAEAMAAEPLELRPQLGVVVDLAVEDELDRPVLVRHRLVGAVREVDDREPARAEADAPVGGDPGARAVGAAMGERVAHPRDVRLLDVETAPGEGSRYPAHVRTPLPDRRRMRRGRSRRARPRVRPRAESARRSCRARRSAGTRRSAPGSRPSTVFVPSSTVTGRSVRSRSVKHGTPSADVSSCTPPESVSTNRASASSARKSR